MAAGKFFLYTTAVKYILQGAIDLDTVTIDGYLLQSSYTVGTASHSAGGIYQIFYDGYQVFVAPSIALNSLTYDPWTELWYGCDVSNLYIVDVTTGETSVIGPLNTPNTIIGISCNLYGEMYGYDILWTGHSTLYSINVDTGECTALGGMGYGFVYAQDCCFDRDYDNDHLYIAGYFNDGSPPAWLLCDVNTGECTIVGSLEWEIDALTFPYGVADWMLYPRANFSWTPSIPTSGEIVFFNASTSDDDDGYIQLYEWDWNNDSIYDESFSIPTTTHLWASPGNYPVIMRVTDDTALTAIKCPAWRGTRINGGDGTGNQRPGPAT